MPERKKRIYDFSLPAYSSADKQDFRHKVTVRFDFKNYDRSIRDLRRSVQETNRSARELTKKLNKTNKGYGVYISAKQVSDRSGFGNEMINLELPGADELSAKLAPFLSEVGQKGKEIMLKYASRKETGLLRKEIRYKQDRPGSGYAQVEIGWIRSWYKYFGWQEEGTVSIPPMNAILRTTVELDSKASGIPQMYSKYFREIFLEKGIG